MILGKIDCYAATDTGLKPEENQDQYLIADLVKAVRIQATSLNHDSLSEVTGPSQGKLFLVADGIGRLETGRRASTLAVDETMNYMVNQMGWFVFNHHANNKTEQNAFASDLANSLIYCQQRIQNESATNSKKQGMGSTMTVAILDWPALHVVHVGGNRCYVDHDGQFNQITRDHKLIEHNDKVSGPPTSSGVIDDVSGDAMTQNVVGGLTKELEPEVYGVELSIGDTLLLCSDGLTSQLDDMEIAQVLRTGENAKHMCESLIERCNAAGGVDNTTVIVARFLDVAETPDELIADVPQDLTAGLNAKPEKNRVEDVFVDGQRVDGAESESISTLEPPAEARR